MSSSTFSGGEKEGEVHCGVGRTTIVQILILLSYIPFHSIPFNITHVIYNMYIRDRESLDIIATSPSLPNFSEHRQQIDEESTT